MVPKLFQKYNFPIMAVSVAIIALAICVNVWMRTKPDNTIPVFTVTAFETARQSGSVSEEEWKEAYATALETAQKAALEANALYEYAEAEKDLLLGELNLTQQELDKAIVDLQSKEPPALDITAIREKYETVGELVTIDYAYEYTTKAIDTGKALSIFESGDLIFWDTKEFLYKISGIMKLGVDISGIPNGLTVDENSKTIVLTIPEAYVIANDPDEHSVERYDLQKGWLNSNPVNDKDLLDAFSALEMELAQRVQENGFLKYAQELAGYQIKDLLQPIASLSGYTVTLKYVF